MKSALFESILIEAAASIREITVINLPFSVFNYISERRILYFHSGINCCKDRHCRYLKSCTEQF